MQPYPWWTPYLEPPLLYQIWHVSNLRIYIYVYIYIWIYMYICLFTQKTLYIYIYINICLLLKPKGATLIFYSWFPVRSRSNFPKQLRTDILATATHTNQTTCQCLLIFLTCLIISDHWSHPKLCNHTSSNCVYLYINNMAYAFCFYGHGPL